MRLTRVVAVLVACSAVPMLDARGQTGAEEPGSRIRIALVTVGPGARIYDRFGHNAIWVQDAEHGIDSLYNYGTYDFDQENFVLRFIRGRMLYRLASANPERSLRFYQSINRSVWIQELRLTPAEKVTLRDFLLWNDRPENREYRYDYYYDNCSTRVRDALDRALGGAIRRQTESQAVEATFRFHTQRLTTYNVWYYTGLMIGLGPMVDEPISAWEEMFLPMALRDHLRNVSVTMADGSTQPLVISERTVFQSTADPGDPAPPTWGMGYLAVGVIIAGILVWLGAAAYRTRRAQIAFSGLAVLWASVVGVLGTVLFGLMTVTDHAVTYWNENLFLFNPLALALAVALALVVLGVRGARRPARGLGAAAAAVSILGCVAQALPWLDQVNGQLYALVLLPNVAVGWGVLRTVRSET